ncbi:MAG: GIY-YIG nuclease family protein [Bacteroidaceae bacterium]|nr:GIY-YIG nuclease family protein [Bacteroidaceae bacterium]
MAQQTEPGYVYILTNPSFREDWVKIGKSARPVNVRSKELDNTAVPLPFEIFATMKTVKYNEAERLVHRYIERFTNLRIRNNREFFNVKPEEALEIFKDVALVIEDAEICEVHKDGLPAAESPVAKPRKPATSDSGKKSTVWLIPYNKKYYNLDGCYEEFGEVYWTMHCNFNPGDTGYIYGAAPESAIRFSFRIEESYMEYQPIMDQDDAYVLKGGRSNEEISNEGNLFAHMRLTGRTTDRRLSLANLLDRGLKTAPMGAMKLSKPELKELLKYIEENF